MIQPQKGVKDSHGKDMTLFAQGAGRVIMILIYFLLFYLAIKKGFEPLLANPKTALLGGAAQFGIVESLVGAGFLNMFQELILH